MGGLTPSEALWYDPPHFKDSPMKTDILPGFFDL
jgi:hypothetical protein